MLRNISFLGCAEAAAAAPETAPGLVGAATERLDDDSAAPAPNAALRPVLLCCLFLAFGDIKSEFSEALPALFRRLDV